MAVLPQGPNSTKSNDYPFYRREEVKEKSYKNAIFISTDLDIKYLPFFAMFAGKHERVGGELRYSIYWLDISQASIKPISIVISAFNTYIKPIQYTKEGVIYYIQKHLIYTISEGKVIILFCTVVEKDYWRLIGQDFVIDKSRFLMVINTDFLTTKYKAFYTYFTKSIMNPLLSSETIDFVVTNDITKYCFKPIETSLQFTTIVEMKQYLLNINERATREFLANG